MSMGLTEGYKIPEVRSNYIQNIQTLKRNLVESRIDELEQFIQDNQLMFLQSSWLVI